MSDIARLLADNLGQSVPLVRITTLSRLSFTISEEKNEAGGWDVYLDVLLSPAAAERYVIPFSAEGFEAFRDALVAAGSGLKIERNLQGLH